MNRSCRVNPSSQSKRVEQAGRPRRENAAERARRVGAICDRLERCHPDAECSLDFESPFQLLVATILSAQCTDKRVNMVTGELFRRWPSPATPWPSRSRNWPRQAGSAWSS